MYVSNFQDAVRSNVGFSSLGKMDRHKKMRMQTKGNAPTVPGPRTVLLFTNYHKQPTWWIDLLTNFHSLNRRFWCSRVLLIQSIYYDKHCILNYKMMYNVSLSLPPFKQKKTFPGIVLHSMISSKLLSQTLVTDRSSFPPFCRNKSKSIKVLFPEPKPNRTEQNRTRKKNPWKTWLEL